MKERQRILIGLGLLAIVPAALAEDYASKERSNAALGHYARARAMLVEALAEFEQARKFARPDVLVDPEEWRLSIISRTEELNRLLDPRPRITREGVRFQANKLLIRRERDRLPVVADGAQLKNTYGEEQRKREMKAARARLDELQSQAEEKNVEEVIGSTEESTDKALSSLPEADNAIKVEKAPTSAAKAATEAKPPTTVVETEEEEVQTPPGIAEKSLFGETKAKEKEAEKPAVAKRVELTNEQENQVSKAIDEAIQERVKTIEAGEPKTESAEDADDEAE